MHSITASLSFRIKYLYPEMYIKKATYPLVSVLTKEGNYVFHRRQLCSRVSLPTTKTVAKHH